MRSNKLLQRVDKLPSRRDCWSSRSDASVDAHCYEGLSIMAQLSALRSRSCRSVPLHHTTKVRNATRGNRDILALKLAIVEQTRHMSVEIHKHLTKQNLHSIVRKGSLNMVSWPSYTTIHWMAIFKLNLGLSIL